MSFLAKLYLNDRVINVLHSYISFHQDKDIANKPVGRVHGAQFTLIVELDATTDLLHQMMSVDRMVDGRVRFFKRDGMSKLYDYEFWDCYIAKYKVNFSSTTTQPTTLELLFSPGILRIGDVVHKKPWHITDLEAEEVEPTPDPGMAVAPELLECYYESKNGEKITSPKKDQKIFLVIKTKGMKGEAIDIDLSDNAVDFEYKGKPLSGDSLSDIKVNGDTMRIELKAIDQHN